jgi:plastocyanin
MRRPTFALLALAGTLAVVTPASATDHAVAQKDKAFSTTAITVKAGDRITFTNADSITHNVYSVTKGYEFDLKTQTPGHSDTVPFPKAGSVDVECAIHPKMKLKVTVAP